MPAPLLTDGCLSQAGIQPTPVMPAKAGVQFPTVMPAEAGIHGRFGILHWR